MEGERQQIVKMMETRVQYLNQPAETGDGEIAVPLDLDDSTTDSTPLYPVTNIKPSI